MKYLIVGGVAGGATAAARLRRLDEEAEIILFEKGEYISYANCGLPYYIGGVIEDREKLFVQTPEKFGRLFNLNVRVKHEVLSIDREQKQVRVRDDKGETYIESYDKLLLSPGALPVQPPIAGIESEGVFTLRNVKDTDAIYQYIEQRETRRAVVIGAGFIGIEMAENLYERGMEVSIVEMGAQVMPPIDYSMASIIHEELASKGIGLHLSKALKEIQSDGNRLTLTLNTGEEISADLVIMSVGVRANLKLAEEAGLTIGKARGIKVDEYLETSDPNIYAVGDAIEFLHPITSKPWRNNLAGPANRQARIVADNMSGKFHRKYEGSIGTSIAKVFGLTVGATGLAAKSLKEMGIDYASATVSPNDHANYYPNAFPLTLKITFDPKTGQLFGAQCVGMNGVDKRIDLLAQIIKHKGTIEELMETEHSYAPPFSSAKDPVALAGYVADNIITGRMVPLNWREMQETDPTKVTILDVRVAQTYELRHIEGAISIPLESLRDRLNELDKDKPIHVYCDVGLRAYLASNILRQNGFKDVKNLAGGFRLYERIRTQYPSEPRPRQPKAVEQKATSRTDANVVDVNACGLSCPGPIVKLKESMDKLEVGQRLLIRATDPGFSRDVVAWCDTTGHKLLEQTSENGKFSVLIEKSPKKQANTYVSGAKGKTFILFSDDLDKALATFVLANGAAATGEKVTIFFTFWGLNAIKKRLPQAPQKDIWGRMFSMMLPKDSKGLGLSKMNMFGMGPKMMRKVMKVRGIDQVETMRAQALAAGVEFIACQMSMDVMGVSAEELLDDVTIGGVATYMNRADDANVNLFI